MYFDELANKRFQDEGIGRTSIRARLRLIDKLRDLGIKHPQVIEVMSTSPRHLFLDEALSHRAYEDSALPIGYKQTLSRPYTVARMSELLLGSGKLRKVLEVGTGSGYQTSILACLVPRVFTIERIESLQEKACKRLKKIGINNVVYRHGDGFSGWPEREPFDAIMVTAAPREIPKALQWQLAEGGCMIIPVGTQQQQLIKITRSGNYFKKEVIEKVNFVPLVGGITYGLR